MNTNLYLYIYLRGVLIVDSTGYIQVHIFFTFSVCLQSQGSKVGTIDLEIKWKFIYEPMGCMNIVQVMIYPLLNIIMIFSNISLYISMMKFPNI